MPAVLNLEHHVVGSSSKALLYDPAPSLCKINAMVILMNIDHRVQL